MDIHKILAQIFRVMRKIILPIIIILVILVAIMVSFCYDYQINGNVLTILSAMWSAAATALLGGIAYWQNKRYKELSDKYSQKIDSLMLTPECHLVSISNHRETGIPYMIANTSDRFLEYNLKFYSLNRPMLDLTVQEIEFCNLEDSAENSYFPHSKIAYNIFNFSIFENCSPFLICITVPINYTNKRTSCKLTLSYKNIYGATLEKSFVLIKEKDGTMRKDEARPAVIIGEI